MSSSRSALAIRRVLSASRSTRLVTHADHPATTMRMIATSAPAPHERCIAPVAPLLCERRRLRLAAAATIAALLDHAGQHVMGQLQPAHALPIVHAQQAAAD